MTDAGPPPTAATDTDRPLNPLEELLYAGLAEPGRMGAFERLMLEVDLFAVPEPDGPGGAPGADGAGVLRPGERLVLRGVVLKDGRNSVTLFTDPRRASQMFGPGTRVMAMQGRTLLDMVRDSVVLMNPAGGRALRMEPEQIRGLLDQPPLPSPARPSGPVERTEASAAEAPAGLIDRLRAMFRGIPLDAAWLARARWPETGQTGWFLDLRTDAPADEVTALCDRAIRGLSFGREAFEVSVARPGDEPGVGVKVV